MRKSNKLFLFTPTNNRLAGAHEGGSVSTGLLGYPIPHPDAFLPIHPELSLTSHDKPPVHP